MRLIFLTSYRYPSARPVYIYMESMAWAFNAVLKKDFTFVVAGPVPEKFNSMQAIGIPAPERLRSLFYFLYLPFFILRQKYNTKESVFFSNDPYLSSILIFWRKILRFKYKIFSDWHQLFEDWRDSYVALHSDYLVSTTKKIRNILLQKTGAMESRAIVSYGGVDLNVFKHTPEPIGELRKRLGLPEEGTLVGYVGFYKTMGMGKGVDTMIKALSFVADTNIKMVFVGAIDNKEIEENKKIAESFGVADRTFFLLAVKAHEVPAYEQAVDMLVIPYPDQPHFRKYGFPMKVYEYMYSKKPIVYSNLEIIDEMLFDCGASVIPDDPHDLAEKIMYLHKEKEVAKQLADKAFDKVLGCTWEKRAENIVRHAGFKV
jgi:glycosyltransferase involved in cell wall biosynthesis